MTNQEVRASFNLTTGARRKSLSPGVENERQQSADLALNKASMWSQPFAEWQ